MTTTDGTGTTAEPKVDGEGDAVDTQVSGSEEAAPASQGRSGKAVAVPLDGRVITPTRVVPVDSPLPDIRDQAAAPPDPVETRVPDGLRPQKARLLSNTRLVDLLGHQPPTSSTAESAQRPVKSNSAATEDAAVPPQSARGGVAPDDAWWEGRRDGREAGTEKRVQELIPETEEEWEVEDAEPREEKRRQGRQWKPRSFSSDVPGSKHLPAVLDTPWRRFLLFWGTAAAAGGYAGVRVWFSKWANDPLHQVDGVLAYAITLVAFTIGVLIFRATKFNPFALFGLLVLAAWLGSTFGPDLLPLAFPYTAKAGLSPYDTKLLANAIGLIGPMAWWMWLLRRKYWLLRWLACALLSSSILACAMFTTAS
ncbi:hypothetical protein [Streptomyces sp. NPDC005538]|uniref:hypothetical protein n=1 Tax=Streptomyces sp. NPDC005538 TaxID=3157043 RepID=UPI0033B832A3